MTFLVARLGLLLLLLGAAPKAFAQPHGNGTELSRLQQEFEFGKFEQVLTEAVARIDRGNLTDEARLELHRLAGLSAFNLGRNEQAKRHFMSMLRIDPDSQLDPFLVPPPAVSFFGELREEMKAELAEIREEQRLAEERAEAARKEAERRRLEAEEQRRRLETMAKQVIVRTEEKRSIFVNFVPFGVGQFQQGRVGTGLAFAAGEVALAATSILAFFAYEGLLAEQEITIDDRQDSPSGRTTRRIKGIPVERLAEANLWRNLKLATGAGFYVLWGLGTAEALWHHQDTVVSEQTVPASTIPQIIPRAPQSRSPSGEVDVEILPRVFMVPGGAGAGLTFNF